MSNSSWMPQGYGGWGGGGGYGGGYGLNPYAALMQQFQQQMPMPQQQAPQMSPQQQLAAQYGGMSRAFYSPFNSPYGGMRQPGPDYQHMQAPSQNFPSIGLSDIVRQWSQGGLNATGAGQQLRGLAGLPPPQTAQWSSQGQAPAPAPQTSQWSSQAQASPAPAHHFSPTDSTGYGPPMGGMAPIPAQPWAGFMPPMGGAGIHQGPASLPIVGTGNGAIMDTMKNNPSAFNRGFTTNV